jgi:secreted trypsin-like serine protease
MPRSRWLLSVILLCSLGVESAIAQDLTAVSQDAVLQIPVSQQTLPGRAKEVQTVTPLKKRSSVLNPQAVELVEMKAKADKLALTPGLSEEEKEAAKSISARSERQLQIAIQQTPFPRISNGRPALAGQFPYQVALVFAGYTDARFGLFCGGSLIAQTWVLTAAHCFDTKSMPGDFEVHVGLLKLSSHGTVIPVKRLVRHPAFNGKTMENDIALLELTTAATGLDPVPLVKSPSDESTILSTHGIAVISGWGETAGGSGVLSDSLLFANIPVATNPACETVRPGEILSTMLCAGNGVGDACSGDSGGPLTVAGADNRRYQEGIASWGTDGNTCGRPNVYGVYTRVPHFMEWINGVMSGVSN